MTDTLHPEFHEPDSESPHEPCFNCGKAEGYRERTACSTEPHGEAFEDEWLQCNACGAETDQAELDAQRARRDAKIAQAQAWARRNESETEAA